jgi:uncharacterized membrane protein
MAIRVLFAGETWLTLQLDIKGFDTFPMGAYGDFGQGFMDAMAKLPDFEVVRMPNHVAFSSFPSSVQELKEFDAVFLSDIGSNTLELYPDLYKVPMGPNRLKVLRDYVKQGGALVMGGGWASFSGEMGKARYHGSAVEEALPVKINQWDDRVETPEGVTPCITKPQHEIFTDISEKWPLFLGYNRVEVKEQAELLAEINGDPFVATWNFGDGRSMAFMSDPCPHWGTAFVKWEHYARFWRQALIWLTKRKNTR